MLHTLTHAPRKGCIRLHPPTPTAVTSAPFHTHPWGTPAAPTDLGEEMGVGQEELLQEVEQGEGSSKLMAQPWLLATFGPAPLIHTGRAGLRGNLEGEQFLQPLRTV